MATHPQGQRPDLISAWASGPGRGPITHRGLKARAIQIETSVEGFGSGLQPSCARRRSAWAVGPGWYGPRRWRSGGRPMELMGNRKDRSPHSTSLRPAPKRGISAARSCITDLPACESECGRPRPQQRPRFKGFSKLHRSPALDRFCARGRAHSAWLPCRAGASRRPADVHGPARARRDRGAGAAISLRRVQLVRSIISRTPDGG